MAEGGGNQPENLAAALQKSYEVVERLYELVARSSSQDHT